MNTEKAPIQRLGIVEDCELYLKREDLYPFSFGGNKARKAELCFREIDAGGYDCVVTYGSSSSNHCRVVSNLAASRKMDCFIISPEEASEPTYNSQMMQLFGAQIRTVSVSEVHDTIEDTLACLKSGGRKPYFIPGGGHGNLGTQAYRNCYDEIREWEAEQHCRFDYIFHASGTGTTQAGLVCGQLIAGDERTIVGISIARKNPRGRQVVLDSIREYLAAVGFDCPEEMIQQKTIFVDSYTGDGYGNSSTAISDTIRSFLIRYGIPLDATYTGKALYGMGEYLKEQHISGAKVLFIHTGGTPLFFDYLKNEETRK